MIIYKTDRESLEEYAGHFHNMIGDIILEENDPKLFKDNGQIVDILNNIVNSLDLEMRFVIRNGTVYIKAKYLAEEAAFFPVIIIIFKEIYLDVIEHPENTELILEHISRALDEQQHLIRILQQ